MKFNFRLEDIKYIKIIYKNKDNMPFITKAGVKSIDDKNIIACGKFENGLNINTPQEVTISVICNDGLYRTKTLLQSVENEVPYVFFTIITPQGIDYEQNREYFRISATYDCIYEVYSEGSIKEFSTKITDISANGVSFILPQHIISEQEAKLKLLINGKTLFVGIKYIRSEKTEMGYKISFTYSKISESDRDFISQVCLKKQIEQKRNAIK